jgi:CRP-like cAMP-binding protein
MLFGDHAAAIVRSKAAFEETLARIARSSELAREVSETMARTLELIANTQVLIAKTDETLRAYGTLQNLSESDHHLREFSSCGFPE